MKVFVGTSIAIAALVASKIQAAFPADVAALMDTTVDPCDDFYQYSCGNWIKNFTLPADMDFYQYSYDGVGSRNDAVIQDIIKEDRPLIGELWDSCMNLDALTALGNKPLQVGLNRIRETSSKEELARVAGEMSTAGPWLFTGGVVAVDARNSTMNVLYVTNSWVTLSDASYYTDPEAFASVEIAYRKYISTIVKLAGISLNGAPVDPQYAEDVIVSIDKQLAAILITDDEWSSPYSTMKYSEAAALYPLTFQAMTEGWGVLEKSTLTVDSTIAFDSLPYMDRAEKLFNSLELEDIKIYYSFMYADNFAEYLGEPFLQAVFDLYNAALRGQTARSTRSAVCTEAQISFFPDLIGEYFFLKMLDVQREENVQLMVDAIEQAMGEHIEKATWVDDATRKEAAAKLSKVANLIGHSTQNKSYPFVLSRDNYFTNVQTLRTQKFKNDVAKINNPVDRSEWDMSAATVNSYYSWAQNKLVFPAAMLQPPFYNGGSHPVQNFGAIGAIIGHELTHGFDSTGRRYDSDGNQGDWWTPQSSEKFETRANCMREQYSSFVAYGDSGKPVGNVNGNLTIGENIADNGGVSLSFDAYHNWLKSAPAFNKNGVSDEEAEKLYFISYAQLWCAKIRDGAQKQKLTTDLHAPMTFRVNGVAMNSVEFANTFQCKAGAKMNPDTKCKIW